MDLISIIIPLYNAELFIEKAYRFIINQKGLKIPFEIIFVDNNSTDRSFEFANRIASEDERVKVFKEKVQGAPAARNKGYLESKGNYLYFFDVDDQLFDSSLNNLVSVLDENKSIDAVFGKFIRSNKNIELLDSEELKESSELIIKPNPYWGLLWLKDLSQTVGPPGFLYRREVFKDLGMYNIKIPGSEDTALDIELGMRFNVAKIDKYIYLYFKHDNATTTKVKKKKSRAFMQWPRLIHSHIPFFLSHAEQKEYGEILKKLIYSSIAKMIHENDYIKQRKLLRDKLLNEIEPIKFPFVLRSYSLLMVYFKSKFLLKLYLYYIMPLYTKNVTLENYDN